MSALQLPARRSANTTVAKTPRAEQWADRICTQLGKTVEAIIDVGRLLVKAKADLAHGEWGRLFDDELVPFSQNTAGQLMKIATHPLLSNSDHGQNLPPSWRTLYELSKVEPKRLRAAFKDGLITPDMPRREIKALLPARAASTRRRHGSHVTPTEDSDAIGYRSAGSRLYFRIARLLSDEFDALSPDEQIRVLSLLEQTLCDLRGSQFQKAVEG